MIFNLMKPIPIAEPTNWETVCEGTYTFKEVYGSFVATEFALGVAGEKFCNIELGDTIRISDSKKSWVVSTYPWGNQPTYILFGNTDLQESPEIKALGIDTDCDYAVNVDCGYLYAREAKTEYLKIERWVGGSPTMYSYNGAVLPKLPSLDKETYTYATIMKSTSTTYSLTLSSVPFKSYFDSTNTEIYEIKNTTYCYCSCEVGEENWGEVLVSTTTVRRSYTTPIWANYDVLSTNGAVRVSESEPIPIYE